MSQNKIIRAVNKMIINEGRITNSASGSADNELFFLYDKMYKWSIVKSSTPTNYYLHYYPGEETIEDLAKLPRDAWLGYSNIVSYSSKELGAREAEESFSELYSIVQEKLHGMDEVLDGIIEGIPF